MQLTKLESIIYYMASLVEVEAFKNIKCTNLLYLIDYHYFLQWRKNMTDIKWMWEKSELDFLLPSELKFLTLSSKSLRRIVRAEVDITSVWGLKYKIKRFLFEDQLSQEEKDFIKEVIDMYGHMTSSDLYRICFKVINNIKEE